jgi:hypothetical protein
MKIFANYDYYKFSLFSLLKNIFILSIWVLPTQTIGIANVEKIPADVKNATHEIISITKKSIQSKATLGAILPDMHANANGCAMAKFSVLRSIPKKLKVGIFKSFGDYPTLIQFSNGYGRIQNEIEVNGLGALVSLMAVFDSKSDKQDFKMVNHPVFLVGNTIMYVESHKFVSAEKPGQFSFPGLNPFRLHDLITVNEMKSRVDANPLETQYWSLNPHPLGRSDIKFSAQSCKQKMPHSKTLDNKLQAQKQRASCLDFMVQIPTDNTKMPLDEPLEWKEQDSPFITVARISIPQQNINSAQQRELCEQLSFNPWNANPELSPLSGDKPVRKAVYQTITRIRQNDKGRDENEPKRFNLSPSGRFY